VYRCSSQGATQIELDGATVPIDELEEFANSGTLPSYFLALPSTQQAEFRDNQEDFKTTLEAPIDIDLNEVETLTLDSLEPDDRDLLSELIPNLNDQKLREAARGLKAAGDGQRTIDFLRAFPEDVITPPNFIDTLITYASLLPQSNNPQQSPTSPTDQSLSFRQGVNGYTGTQDTWLSQEHPNRSFAKGHDWVVDDDTDDNFFDDFGAQGLIRFDGIFGTGIDQVPLKSTINQAELQLTLQDDIDFIFDVDFFVHQMLRDWNEDSTWNSLGNGLSPGSEYDAKPVAVFAGDNEPESNRIRTLDITAAVQRWATGESNYGLAVLPEIIDSNDDGIDVYSADDNRVNLRPLLTIDFTSPAEINDPISNPTDPATPAPEPLSILGTVAALGLGVRLKWRSSR
jgi:hypothetical protein